MIENLNYADIGKWVKFTDGDGKENIGRIKMYDNAHKHIWIIVMPYTNKPSGNDWRGSPTTKMRYAGVSYYQGAEADHEGAV